LIGLTFSLLDIKPIPAIILAQAINGVLLPIFTVFVFLIINDIRLLRDGYTNNLLLNLLTLVVVGMTCFLGLYNLLTALSKIVSLTLSVKDMVYIAAALSSLVVVALFGKVYISKK
jgi:Mn2+/Fe2+ NRAMP family transporter